MKWKIVVDSSCDLRELTFAHTEEIVFAVVSLKIIVGEREFVDEKGLDTVEMLEVMENHHGKTSSSAPNAGEWKEAFADGENVFAITISGALSGSAAGAHTARHLLEQEGINKNIKIIDSLSTGPEMTLYVEKLVEYIEQGLSFEKVSAKIDKYAKNVRLLYVLESLDNLIKNGRVSKLEGGLAGLLGIRILGTASSEGTLELLHKCRGQKKVYDHMLNRMIEDGFDGGRVVISHCLNEQWAEYLKAKIKEKFASCRVTVMPTGGLCSYYAQRHGILLGYEISGAVL